MRGSEWITLLLPRCLVGIVNFRVFLFQHMQPVGLISNNSHKTLTGQSASDPQHPSVCSVSSQSQICKEFFAHLSSRSQSTVAP